jgi:hypothetical protein
VTRKTRANPYVSAKSVSIESTAKREPQSATRGPVGPKGKTDMPELIVVTLELPRDEAAAFAELLKRTSCHDCLRRSNGNKRYGEVREEVDVMWSGLRMVESQLADAAR